VENYPKTIFPLKLMDKMGWKMMEKFLKVWIFLQQMSNLRGRNTRQIFPFAYHTNTLSASQI